MYNKDINTYKGVEKTQEWTVYMAGQGVKIDRGELIDSMIRFRGNRSAVAEDLGVPYHSVWRIVDGDEDLKELVYLGLQRTLDRSHKVVDDGLDHEDYKHALECAKTNIKTIGKKLRGWGESEPASNSQTEQAVIINRIAPTPPPEA